MNLVQTQVILHFENVKMKSILLGYFLFIDIKNLLTNQKTEFSKITVWSYRVGSLTVSYCKLFKLFIKETIQCSIEFYISTVWGEKISLEDQI